MATGRLDPVVDEPATTLMAPPTDAPAPDVTVTYPPDCDAPVVVPAAMVTAPPESVLAVPALITMEPLVPPAATPVAMVTGPVLPWPVVPDPNKSDPVTPAVAAGDVYTLRLPVDALLDPPDINTREPPANAVLSPASRLKVPPAPWPYPADTTVFPPVRLPDSEGPPVNDNWPPVLAADCPTAMEMDPDGVAAAPVPMVTPPDAPAAVVPDDSNRLPDTPAATALADRIHMDPLEVACPMPDDRATRPPVPVVPAPATRLIFPPANAPEPAITWRMPPVVPAEPDVDPELNTMPPPPPVSVVPINRESVPLAPPVDAPGAEHTWHRVKAAHKHTQAHGLGGAPVCM